MSKKFYQLSFRESETSAANVIQSVIANTQIHVFQKKIMDTYKTQMAKQIVTAQKQSIQQIRSYSPEVPYSAVEDPRPNKGISDTIRPYSAKVERLKKINTANLGSQLFSSKRTSIFRTSPSMKSFKSMNNIVRGHRRQQKSELSKYKSKLIPLNNNEQQNQECDKIIQLLRRNKLKAQEYQKSKQNFLNLISKESQENSKKQAKFASTMTRKDYTYSYTGQIVEIPKEKKWMKKKTVASHNTIRGSAPRKSQQTQKKQSVIQVQFAKREPRTELKYFIFANGENVFSPQTLCPVNSHATKFMVHQTDL